MIEAKASILVEIFNKEDILTHPKFLSVFKSTILLSTASAILCAGSIAAARSSIYSVGSSFHGVRDFREVLPGVLYRGGANNGRSPLNSNQLRALCESGMGSSVYLYNSGFAGASNTSCAQGSMSYQYTNYQGQGLRTIHRMIHQTIKTNGKPVFVHCWYGIHATGLVAATALMQFCDINSSQAVEYWKVGIAPSLQYPHVIEAIRNFRPDPNLRLSAQEQRNLCPQM